MNLLKKFFYLFFPIISGTFIGFLLKNLINYNSLNKPLFYPPTIVFPIVWTLIYLLMGIAYLIYRKSNNNKDVIAIYYSQLFINLIWPIIFFWLKGYLFSIVWIILLIISVIILMKKLKIEKKISYYLFIPYLLWLFFATYLNIGIYLLN